MFFIFNISVVQKYDKHIVFLFFTVYEPVSFVKMTHMLENELH